MTRIFPKCTDPILRFQNFTGDHPRTPALCYDCGRGGANRTERHRTPLRHCLLCFLAFNLSQSFLQNKTGVLKLIFCIYSNVIGSESVKVTLVILLQLHSKL